MTPGSVVHVACAARGPYVRHSAAMLHSVLVNAGEGTRIHYLCEPGLAEQDAERLESLTEQLSGEISFLRVEEERVRGLPVQPEFTAAMWYRLLLPELLPEVDRVLYLDIDTIALDDLGELWRIPLGDNYVAAVTNVFQPNHLHRPAEIGLPDGQEYFNSGVLLMNLARMRADGSAREMWECALEMAGRIEWPDQDVLNLVLGRRRVPLHPRWNCMNSILSFPASKKVFGRRAVRQARRSPGIRHFEGPGANKPWNPACSLGDRAIYFDHLAETPWGSAPTNGVSA